MSANNNYAAPNTPIASAKRQRVTTSTVKSPVAKALYVDVDSVHPESTEDNDINGDDMHIASPSKNLFSPYPKYEEDGAEQHSRHSTPRHSPTRLYSDSPSTPEREEVKDVEKVEEVQQYDVQDEEEDDEDVFNPYLFIACLPPHEVVTISNRKWLPSADHQKLTLALDLDETLVHCTVDIIPNPDIIFPVAFNGTLYEVYVKKRPYLDQFLEAVSSKFEVVLFTASQEVYADALLNLLDPQRKWIRHRLFREACVNVHGNFLKDLTVLGRELCRTVLVDNSPHAYGFQIDNGIPIESWFDDPTDSELLKLMNFLNRIHGVEDVRPHIRTHFKTYQLVNSAKEGKPVSLRAPPF